MMKEQIDKEIRSLQDKKKKLKERDREIVDQKADLTKSVQNMELYSNENNFNIFYERKRDAALRDEAWMARQRQKIDAGIGEHQPAAILDDDDVRDRAQRGVDLFGGHGADPVRPRFDVFDRLSGGERRA